MIICGDARSIPLAAASVQCVVTSPPYYGLRDYGHAAQIGLEASPDAYVATLVSVFREVWRVLKADGVCWLNLGDSYASGEIGRHDGRVDGSGNGARHVGPRQHLRLITGLKAKDLVGIPWRVAFALQADGWYLRSDVIWHKPNPMPESVTDRPTKAHEYVFLLTKQERYYYDADAIADAAISSVRVGAPLSGGYSAGAGRNDDNSHRSGGFAQAKGTRNKRSVWTVVTQPYPDAHFATMPEALVEPCVLAGSRHGDIVLDPFLGSGTVGRVATSLGRRFVGIELSAAYCALARDRCHVTRGLPLELPA